MTGGWTGLSVRRPIGVAVLSAIVCILGGIAATRLKVDLLPEVDFPRISILTNYPGVGPEEIENLLTRPIERAVSTVEGVTALEGESAEGLSRVQLQFDWGINLESAASDVREALDRLRAVLPEDAEQPAVLKFDISATPVATIGLSGGSDPRRLRYLADELLTRRLERLPGIASVQVNGGRVREIRVELLLPRLVALGVTADQVIEALGRDNRNVSAGDMTESGREILVRTLGELRSVEEVGAVLVAGRAAPQVAQGSAAQPGGQPARAQASAPAVETGAGRPIYVRDVADVSDAFQEIVSEQWVDGVPGVVMRVSKQADANTVEVVERLEQEMALINAEYEGWASVVLIHDTAAYIESAITNVRTTALFGAGLAVLVLLLFLRDLRATIVIALAIPFSVMATFALMYFSGFSLNLISFGGLALGVGMLVDNAIVILENIYRRRQEGLPPQQAAIEGAHEVTGAVVAGTMTTIAVFAPVVFMAGFTGVFFTELAMVVVFSLVCSLIVSITLVPTLAARMLTLPERPPATGLLGRIARLLEGGFAALETGYGRALRAVLHNRWLTIAAALVLLAAAYRLSSAIDVELMPQTDEGVVDLDFELPVGTPVERTRTVVRELERRIRAVVSPEEIASVVSSAGPDNPYRPGGGHEGEVEVTLVPVSERERGSGSIIASIRAAIADMPELDVRLRQRTTNPLQRFMRGSQGERLVVEVRGHDLEIAAQLARRVESVMKSVPGIEDVRIGREEGLEERTVLVDTARAADLGLTRAEIARTIETYVLGRVATRLRDGGDEYDVRVMLRESDRARTDQLGALPVVSSRGVVPLSAVAEVGARRGPSSIEREGQERVLSIVGGIGERALSDVVSDLEEALLGVERPSGFSLAVAGEAREQEIAFQGLGVGIALAILLVFAVMAVQFESLRNPFLIMAAVPFGFVGVVATLVATGTTFSLNAFLGCIVLVGVSVNNAIVLVDAANQLRAQHGNARAAMIEAGRRRLRPVLMTTSTTVLGVLPIALAVGEGSEIQAPLARVIVGGLLVSTLITLLLVPALYGLSLRRRTEAAPPG
jgi:HAE1 family hydrophobic/amphiphilic exporter-1